jgi:hypothetical protein
MGQGNRMRLKGTTLGVFLVLFGTLSWLVARYFGILKDCERTCSASPHEAPLKLQSGVELGVISRDQDSDGELVIDYETAVENFSLDTLCAEARDIWQSIRAAPETQSCSRVVLEPTNKNWQFIGLHNWVFPVVRCCTSLALTFERDENGKWWSQNCASDRDSPSNQQLEQTRRLDQER